jgi:thymidylate synthase (methanogen type)
MEGENNQPQQPANPYAPLIVEADNLAEAWEKAVRAMMARGYERFVKAPEYQCSTRDAPMFIMVKDPTAEPRLSSKAPITREMVNQYAENLIHGLGQDKEKAFEYTYYSRLRHYPDCAIRAGLPYVAGDAEIEAYKQKVSGGKCCVKKLDQVQEVINIFKKDPTRRTAVMHTWVPLRDLAKFTPERIDTSSPCLVLMHPQIVEDKLHMNVVMKTNDLYNAWSGNAFAFSALQEHIAKEIGIGVGHYNHFSVAMQVYEDMYEQARQV